VYCVEVEIVFLLGINKAVALQICSILILSLSSVQNGMSKKLFGISAVRIIRIMQNGFDSVFESKFFG